MRSSYVVSGFSRTAATAVFLALLFVRAAHAHEIGTTRVTANLSADGRYDIAIVTDPASLGEKLGVPPERLASAAALFATRVGVLFDHALTRPDIAFGGDAIHLTGRIPEGARTFAWRYGWTFASYGLTVRGTHGDATTEWLEGGDTSRPFALRAAAPSLDRVGVARTYLALGFTHILPYGLDHVLFVLGIYLLSRRARAVLSQVTAFTVAHSITLGLSLYGVIDVAPSIVEPMIAISIAYVAIENIVVGELRPWRVALVFAFGLLHGMGFAGALRELGLPRSEFITALVSFNVGVECGQIAVIGAAFLAVGARFGGRTWYRQRIVIPASAAIACVALYWTVERLAL